MELAVQRLTVVLVLIAGVFLFWMLAEVGWEPLTGNLERVGWGFPLLLLPYALTNGLEAYTWSRLLPDGGARLGLLRFARLRLAGEALNVLTPTATLGGEPSKAAGLIQAGYAMETAAASLVLHKALRVLSLSLYVLLGLALAATFLPQISPYLKVLLLGGLGLGAGALGFIAVQYRQPCRKALRLLELLNLCPASLKAREAELARIDEQLTAFYRDRRGLAARLLAVQMLAWAANAVEIYLIFLLLGAPLSPVEALTLDSLGMIFTGLGFFLPMAVGMQEGGNLLLALGFHLGAALGAAFSIIRRLREAFWMGLGLLLAARRG
jgi:uncharacterized protein (TIRG00374 family)